MRFSIQSSSSSWRFWVDCKCCSTTDYIRYNIIFRIFLEYIFCIEWCIFVPVELKFYSAIFYILFTHTSICIFVHFGWRQALIHPKFLWCLTQMWMHFQYKQMPKIKTTTKLEKLKWANEEKNNKPQRGVRMHRQTK